jgi:hypothetical protein
MGEREVSGDEPNLTQVTKGISRSSADPASSAADPDAERCEPEMLAPMDPVLRESVEPVLRDLSRAGIKAPTFDDNDWVGDREYVSSMMWSADGSGSGVSVQRAAPLAERIAQAADQVQEWAIAKVGSAGMRPIIALTPRSSAGAGERTAADPDVAVRPQSRSQSVVAGVSM